METKNIHFIRICQVKFVDPIEEKEKYTYYIKISRFKFVCPSVVNNFLL